MHERSWMEKLADHYERSLERHPNDWLLILFDIDGTILDMRHTILHVLRDYDRRHDTHHFDGLKLEDIRVHENQVGELLAEMGLEAEDRLRVLNWYRDRRWSDEAVFRGHRPFAGVMEVIRWFQIQPRTFVGLNTGRPEELRGPTLRSLNMLGDEYKVTFEDGLLHMNPEGWEQHVERAKMQGIRYFQEAGYRVVAFVDNEPANLRAVSEIDPDGEILLLHADTIFESQRSAVAGSIVSGNSYDLTDLAREDRLPSHVRFVWHGLNDRANLRQFLASNVRWGEMDVQWGPEKRNPILRHDTFEESPLREDEEVLPLDDVLRRLLAADRAVKIDFKAGDDLVDVVVDHLFDLDVAPEDLWFNGNVDRLGQDGFRKLSRAFPGATIQVGIDDLTGWILENPGVRELLEIYRGWGATRFSMSWRTRRLREVLDRLQGWGYETNVYAIPDLASFLRTVLLLPTSVTTDFNFPKWHYFGRGSGENLRWHEYVRKDHYEPVA